MATKSKTTTSKKDAAKTSAKKSASKEVKVSTAKKPVAKKAAAPKKATASKTTAVKSMAKKTATATKKTEPKATKPAAKKTTKTTAKPIRLVVKHDAGFGNKVFIRGNAPGLSWDEGVEMENTANDEWIWRAPRTTKSYEVKVLINDHSWDLSENVVVQGKKIVHYPTF